MNLILFGAQGSGKGTQSQLLAEHLRLKPCSSGDLLREAIGQGTSLGQEAKPYVERGDLVPDDLIVGLILEQMRDLGDRTGIILDGFPRTIPQAQRLDASVTVLRQRIDAAIYLEVPRQVLLDRLAYRYVCEKAGHVWNLKTHPPRVDRICDFDGSPLIQRSDDTEAKIAHRLDIFFNETIRLIDYYAARGKLVHINGNNAPETVNQHILAALGQLGVLEGAGHPHAQASGQ